MHLFPLKFAFAIPIVIEFVPTGPYTVILLLALILINLAIILYPYKNKWFFKIRVSRVDSFFVRRFFFQKTYSPNNIKLPS